MDIDSNVLLASFVFGMVGMGMVMFGKKSGRVVPMAAGVGLMAVPYVISNLIVLIAVGAVLSATPWIVRDQ